MAVIRNNVTVRFFDLDLIGDVDYDPELQLLELMTDEGTEPLSISLDVYGLRPNPGNVFVKDWSEHEGLAASLQDAGVVEIVARHHVGPFQSRAYEVQVLAR